MNTSRSGYNVSREGEGKTYMQTVDRIHTVTRRNQGLGDNLPTEHASSPGWCIQCLGPEQVHVDVFDF